MKQKRKKLGRKLLGFLLTLAMVIGLLSGMSLTAYAAQETKTVTWDYAKWAAIKSGDTTDRIKFTGYKSGGNLYDYDTTVFNAPAGYEFTRIEFPTTSTYIGNGEAANGGTFSVVDYTFYSTQDRGTRNGKKVTWTGKSDTVSFKKDTYAIEYITFTMVGEVVGVESITINNSELTLTVGGTQTLTATVSPNNATDKTVKWSVGGTDTGAVKLYTDENCTTEVGANATDKLTVYAKGVSAGTATVTATSNADANKSASCAVTVNKANPTAPTGLTATYGQTLANVTLPDGWTWADSTQSVGNVVDPAATFKANFAGNDNYKAASNVDVTVTVGKADPTAPTGLTATYGQTLANVTLPDGWTWVDSTQSVGNVVDPAATFKANFAGDDNHNAASDVDVTVTVGKAEPTAPTGLTATYGQTLANVTLPDGWTWVDSAQSVGSVVSPAATFKANFAGDDNHNAASNVDVTVTVGKANAVAATVTANNRTYDGTEKPLVTVTGEATGGEMQYALGTATEATEPYTTSIPAKTDAGTYYVWYKVVGDENHNDSEPDCVTSTIKKKSAPVSVYYELILSTTEGASGEPTSSVRSPILAGTSVTVTAADPAEGCRFAGWFLGDVCVSEEQVYTFVMRSYTKLQARYEADSKDGLVLDPDGVWRVYEDNVFREDYIGLYEYDGGLFFIANGELCADANGLNLNGADGKWYFLANGQVQTRHSGFAEYDGSWFMIEKGMLDENANGLYEYDGGVFAFAAGRLRTDINGLWLNPLDNRWYFLANGQVQTQHTGVAGYDGAFFVIADGELDSDYNGRIWYDGALFNVVCGQLYGPVEEESYAGEEDSFEAAEAVEYADEESFEGTETAYAENDEEEPEREEAVVDEAEESADIVVENPAEAESAA